MLSLQDSKTCKKRRVRLIRLSSKRWRRPKDPGCPECNSDSALLCAHRWPAAAPALVAPRHTWSRKAARGKGRVPFQIADHRSTQHMRPRGNPWAEGRWTTQLLHRWGMWTSHVVVDVVQSRHQGHPERRDKRIQSQASLKGISGSRMWSES